MPRNDPDFRMMRRLWELAGDSWLSSIDDEGCWVVGLEAGAPAEIIGVYGNRYSDKPYASVVEPDDVRILAREHDYLAALTKAVEVLEREQGGQ